MKKYECFGAAGMLTLLGGFLDAYTYTCRDGVFANAQTGNVVKFGIALASGEVWLMLRYAIPILAFVLGVLLSVWFCHQTHGRRYVLLTEGAIVLLVSLMPSSAVMNTLANVLISFMCALQAEAFRKVLGLSYASTMCTGNLRSLSEALARFIAHQDQQALKQMQQYLLIIGYFYWWGRPGNLANVKDRNSSHLMGAFCYRLGGDQSRKDPHGSEAKAC